ncbi:hypothetical protein QUB47_33145, partial [Microcoleus sp. AT9_B5]
ILFREQFLCREQFFPREQDARTESFLPPFFPASNFYVASNSFLASKMLALNLSDHNSFPRAIFMSRAILSRNQDARTESFRPQFFPASNFYVASILLALYQNPN